MVTIAAVYGTTIQSINWSFVVISQDEWNEVVFSTSPIFIGLTWIKQHFNGWKWLRATFSGLKTHSTRGWKSWIWFASKAFRAKPSVRRKTKQPAASWIDTMGFWISPWRQRNSKISGSTVIFFLVPKFGWSANLLFCQKVGHEKTSVKQWWHDLASFRFDGVLFFHLATFCSFEDHQVHVGVEIAAKDEWLGDDAQFITKAERKKIWCKPWRSHACQIQQQWSVICECHGPLNLGSRVPPCTTHFVDSPFSCSACRHGLSRLLVLAKNVLPQRSNRSKLDIAISMAKRLHIPCPDVQRCFKRAIYGAFPGWYTYYRSSWETSSLNIGGAFPAALGPILSRFKNWSPHGPRGPCWDLVGTLLVYPAVSRPSLMPPFLNLHPQTLRWLVLFLAMLSRLRQGQVVESSETPRGEWGSSLQSTVSGAVIDKGKQCNYLKSYVSFFWKTQNETKPPQEISATSFK